ncbi:MAG TPA: NADH-quinone oxidoreductase subunit NuoK [Polyangiaceae bacterium]
MTLTPYLLLAAALFCVGLYGLLTRRSALGALISIELMANAANINLVACSRSQSGGFAQVFALFLLALTVAEVVIGIAIVLLLFRTHKDAELTLARDFKH